MPELACPICRAASAPAGVKRGHRTRREFALRRCTACGFGFVAEPWTDYAQIYDEAYYEGHGSDPWVDYVYEFEQPARTVRALSGWNCTSPTDIWARASSRLLPTRERMPTAAALKTEHASCWKRWRRFAPCGPRTFLLLHAWAWWIM